MLKQAIAITLGIGLAAGALGHSSNEERQARMFDRIADRLELQDSQRFELQTILSEQWKKGRELRASIREQVHSAKESLRAETLERLGKVLTAEQLLRFQRLQERKQGHGKRVSRAHRRHSGDRDSGGSHE